MKGSLIERYGKYYAVFNVKNTNGKWAKKYVKTGLEFKPENESAAQSILENEIKMYLEAKPIEAETFQTSNKTISIKADKNKTLFSSFVNEWMKKKENEARTDEVTDYFYHNICSNYIIPYFKERKIYLEDLDYHILQEFVDYERTKDKKPLCPSSLKKLKITLRLILKDARMQRLIIDDPSEFIVLPKQSRRLPTFYNEEQLTELFEKIKGDYIYNIIYVTVLYGLRRSEVLGLKWDSVDFENKLVTIKHTVVRTNRIVEKDRTKTDSSFRTFPMSKEIENLLLNLREEENKNRLKYKENYTENDYIFKWPDGTMFNPDQITRRFVGLLKKYGLPPIRFHDLRHSCASLLMSKGFQLKDVQEWLGHADIETTANIYGHLDQSRKKELMNAFKF